MNYLAFEFTISEPEQSEQLIALLSEQGFEGFEESDNLLKAFIPENIFNENTFNAITGLFSSIIYTRSIVENINWNKQWEQSFEPVVVDDFVAIRAHFHQPIAAVKHEIIITPKMSFGTGHHGTTYIMMQHMQAIDFVGKSVLDFGTGTGVLAILAEKLGDRAWYIESEKYYYKNVENYFKNLARLGLSYEGLNYEKSIPFLLMLPKSLNFEK